MRPLLAKYVVLRGVFVEGPSNAELSVDSVLTYTSCIFNSEAVWPDHVSASSEKRIVNSADVEGGSGSDAMGL